MMEQVPTGVEIAEETVSAGALAGEAVITIAIGLVVVFSVLLLLTAVFKLFGIVMSSIEKNKAPEQPKIPAMPMPAPMAAAPVVGNTEQVSSTPNVDGGVPGETVAAISAAVAAMAPEGTQYAVKSIKKL